ncbi:MAG: matrixin family metalloprotease [Campylobacterota bacterium]|nr:matrixin family metalloprotease [Campylobacterota bacterium]
MKVKFIALLLLTLSNFIFAAYQKVSIGEIDPHYNGVLNRAQLTVILKNIEHVFESQLHENIFDHELSGGKPIDILYVPPSKMKQSIQNNIQKLKNKKIKIKNLQEYLSSKKTYISTTQKQLKKLNKNINDDVKFLNQYIKEKNNSKYRSQYEFQQTKKKIARMKKDIFTKKDKFQQKRIKFNNFIATYKQKILRHNSSIKQYNRLQRKIEIMARSTKEVKGVAIGHTKTQLTTFYKEGKKHQEKTITNYMKKIEIYGFDNLAQLKAILAHEIGHLVGIDHINKPKALMNPMLQKNQIKNLQLTADDIQRFKSLF